MDRRSKLDKGLRCSRGCAVFQAAGRRLGALGMGSRWGEGAGFWRGCDGRWRGREKAPACGAWLWGCVGGYNASSCCSSFFASIFAFP